VHLKTQCSKPINRSFTRQPIDKKKAYNAKTLIPTGLVLGTKQIPISANTVVRNNESPALKGINPTPFN
jgi:hypothetical protein